MLKISDTCFKILDGFIFRHFFCPKSFASNLGEHHEIKSGTPLNNYGCVESRITIILAVCFPCRPTVNEKFLNTLVTPPSLSVSLLCSGQIWSFVRLARTPFCSKRWRKFRGFVVQRTGIWQTAISKLAGTAWKRDLGRVLLAITLASGLCWSTFSPCIKPTGKVLFGWNFQGNTFATVFGGKQMNNTEQSLYQVKLVCFLNKMSSYLFFQEQSPKLWFDFWNCTSGAALLHAWFVHWSADVPITVSTFWPCCVLCI